MFRKFRPKTSYPPKIYILVVDIAASEISYVDDGAFFFLADTPKGLIVDIESATRIIVNTCLENALIPNMNADNTEVLIQLRGAQTNEVRHQLYIEQNSVITIHDTMLGNISLHVTREYNHMGGWVTVAANMGPELSISEGRIYFGCIPPT
jgi:hypothetical protein